MKVYELIEDCKPSITKLQEAGVKLKDVAYLPMYYKYLEMKEQGHKRTYIAEKLAAEYGITSRYFYYIARKFGSVL